MFYVVSIITFAWLILLAVCEIRKVKVPGLYGTAIPLIVAMIFCATMGAGIWLAVSTIVLLAVSERQHLQHRALEALALAAGIVAIGMILFLSDLPTQSGIAAIVIFWFAWERNYLKVQAAITLIICVLIWPGTGFLLAYLIGGLVWSLGIRIKEGGWLKTHTAPSQAVIALGALAYIFWTASSLLLK
jgi:hypothetical protein